MEMTDEQKLDPHCPIWLALTGCFSEEAKEVEAVAEPLKVTAADKIYYGGDILTMAGDKQSTPKPSRH